MYLYQNGLVNKTVYVAILILQFSPVVIYRAGGIVSMVVEHVNLMSHVLQNP